jgi:regulation of enolase protein 1 (concanavalin A-like superfamily)
MSRTRRTFMQQSLAAALAAGGTATAVAAKKKKPIQPAPQAELPPPVPGKPWLEAGELISKMNWLNPPAEVNFSAGTVTVKSKPRTDFWRKTFYGYVTDNGHLFSVPVFGEFIFQARVSGKYAALYDQAGLMVRLDDKHWMKCGSELVEGKRWASVVFTHEFSDWSTLEDLSQTEPVSWRVIRRKDSIEAQCSKDGVNFTTVRQGYFQPFVEVQVGIMCAAPEGAGFEATFEELRLDKL